MDRKIMTLGAVLLLAAAFTAGYIAHGLNKGVTGQVIVEVNKSSYSWTTAICNDNKECIDVLVECENGSVAGLKPVSDIKEFSQSWEDPRIVQGKYCE